MNKFPVIFPFLLIFMFLFLSGCTSQSQPPVMTNTSLKTFDSASYGLSFQYPGGWILTANETVRETLEYHPMKSLRLNYTNSSNDFTFIISEAHHRLSTHEEYMESEGCGGGWTNDRDNLTVLEAYNETLIGDGVHARRFIFMIENPEGETIETIYEICRSYKSGTRTHYWVFWSVHSDHFLSIRPEVQKLLDSIRISEPEG
jgi:hypothetical protein